ncbi:replication restart helicase PriA [Desulforamulus ruminis]|uniref:replication restart helicase PriA n=1 Tax=Desulforamulus ruminis TaxID=1564 RepID=UPI002352532B|nr:primosomal protein N' [Desulforamulus ruminis]
MAYAEVAVSLPVGLEQTFHYRVPESLTGEAVQYSRVEVPFSGRTVQGFILGFSTPPQLKHLKEIKRVLEKEPFLNHHLYELAQWMVQRYLCSLGDALQCIAGSPVGQQKAERSRGLVAAEEGSWVGLARAPKQKQALEVALARPGLRKSQLAKTAGVSVAVIEALLAKGLLREGQRPEPVAWERLDRESWPELTAEQSLAVHELTEALQNPVPLAWLLHGVTGSGKTEVYLRAIAETLSMGRQAIVLVPEISLTPQMVERFQSRFGSAVAVLHSALSQGEKYAEKARIRNGQATVVLGARSAVFAPVANLGLIIIDEEHESSYKQEETPKYHTREVALQRVALAKGVVLLGSATPALESYCRARPGGPYRLLTLSRRVDRKTLPQVQIIDLKKEMAEGNFSIFSRPLVRALARRLERNEKSILFLNRRGFATFVVCRHCGQVMRCPHCEISLTLHSNGRLRCHYCGFGVRSPGVCPACGSKTIRSFGVGTQRVEEELQKLFPGCESIRMDADTTSRKGSHKKLLDQFRQGGAKVLIGTQMIAKGLDIPQVTLVGVVSADLSLHMPDFRSAERTFQLLTQVAGRAGRGEIAGEVMIQTYDPEHYSITTAQNHDFLTFYAKEMTVRQALRYPPYSHLIRILFTGLNEADVIGAGQWWRDRLVNENGAANYQGIEILGPAPAGIPKIKDRYRWQLMIKGSVSKEIRQITRSVLEQAGIRFKQVSVSIDVDPV